MDVCRNCGFWNVDYGTCTCPSGDMWYACPVESEKPENKKALEELCDQLQED